jgi:carbon-monoxide dehydrogenase small subunit
MQTVSFNVNGRAVTAQVEPRTHLADFLREQLLLSGTHIGCEHGVCGACTLLIDGAPARSCITYAVTCNDADIHTIEGLADDPLMERLRTAFSRHHALQCGYCTPGMLISAHDIVRRLPQADEKAIREELSGNLCRCTGYAGIVKAIQEVLSDLPGLKTTEIPISAVPALSQPDTRLPVATAETTAAPAAIQTAVQPGDSNTLSRQLTLELEADALWRLLHDVETLTRCLPGAELTGPAGAEPLQFRFQVAIGPMRAAFNGQATIRYDDGKRSGRFSGSGLDSASRSSGEGRIDFAVRPLAAGRSQLDLSISYALKGALAQFSRAGVVSAVVDRLLDRFAANLAAGAAGATVANVTQISGVEVTFAALWQKIRSLLRNR